MSKNPISQYQRTAVTTASREQLVIMLYEACIKNLNKAIEGVHSKDLAAKGVAVGKAHDILNELTNSLNHDVGGEISKNLEGLYSFFIRELIDGNLKNDTHKFETVKKMLEDLLSGWRQAIASLQAQKAKS